MCTTRTIATLTGLIVLLAIGTAQAQRGRPWCPLTTQPTTPKTQLAEPARQALLTALADERHAKAFYNAVLDKFGPVMPFAHIANAEARHEAALLSLLKGYGIEAPADPWTGKKPDVPATVDEARKLAVEAELANVQLYNTLLSEVTEPDIRVVMENLRAASLDRHLPAFSRWAGATTQPAVDKSDLATDAPVECPVVAAGDADGDGDLSRFEFECCR